MAISIHSFPIHATPPVYSSDALVGVPTTTASEAEIKQKAEGRPRQCGGGGPIPDQTYYIIPPEPHCLQFFLWVATS